MKLNICSGAYFILVLLIMTESSGRSIAVTKGAKMVIEEPNHYSTSKEAVMQELMGLERCYNEDVECLQRRLISEAHLDYIYTQTRHKPQAPLFQVPNSSTCKR